MYFTHSTYAVLHIFHGFLVTKWTFCLQPLCIYLFIAFVPIARLCQRRWLEIIHFLRLRVCVRECSARNCR
jgi:hypothetical protein